MHIKLLHGLFALFVSIITSIVVLTTPHVYAQSISSISNKSNIPILVGHCGDLAYYTKIQPGASSSIISSSLFNTNQAYVLPVIDEQLPINLGDFTCNNTGNNPVLDIFTIGSPYEFKGNYNLNEYEYAIELVRSDTFSYNLPYLQVSASDSDEVGGLCVNNQFINARDLSTQQIPLQSGQNTLQYATINVECSNANQYPITTLNAQNNSYYQFLYNRLGYYRFTYNVSNTSTSQQTPFNLTLVNSDSYYVQSSICINGTLTTEISSGSGQYNVQNGDTLYLPLLSDTDCTYYGQPTIVADSTRTVISLSYFRNNGDAQVSSIESIQSISTGIITSYRENGIYPVNQPLCINGTPYIQAPQGQIPLAAGTYTIAPYDTLKQGCVDAQNKTITLQEGQVASVVLQLTYNSPLKPTAVKLLPRTGHVHNQYTISLIMTLITAVCLYSCILLISKQ